MGSHPSLKISRLNLPNSGVQMEEEVSCRTERVFAVTAS